MAKKLYIDIDKAVGMGYLSDWYQNSIDDTKPPIWTDDHIYELVNDFLIIPNDTPTADVEEVKHGEWIEESYIDEKRSDFMCSVCEFDDTFYKNSMSFYKYCPYCGAKMDGTPKERGGEK